MDVDFWNAFSVCPFGLLPHDPSLSHTFFCNYLNQFVHFHLNSFHLHWHKESVYRLSLHSEFQLQFSRFNNVWLHSTIDVWIWIEYHCTLALHFWLYLLLSGKHPENTQCSHKHPEACAGTALHMCSIILWSWYSKGNVAEWPLMGGNSTDPYMETCAFQTRAL